MSRLAALRKRIRIFLWRFERDMLIADLARLQADHRVLVPRWRQRVADLQKRIVHTQKAGL